MGLGNAFRRVYRYQAMNLIRLLRWLFWAAAFFGMGFLVGYRQNATPEQHERERIWMFVGIGAFAVAGFLLRLWEWRLNRPITTEEK